MRWRGYSRCQLRQIVVMAHHGLIERPFERSWMLTPRAGAPLREKRPRFHPGVHARAGGALTFSDLLLTSRSRPDGTTASRLPSNLSNPGR